MVRRVYLKGDKMKAKKYSILAAVVAICCVTVFIYMVNADTEKQKFPKFSTTVRLSITADEPLQNQIYSYISRELRSLGDVEIVNQDAEWVINVVAMTVHSKSGTELGVAFSTVVLGSSQTLKVLVDISELSKKEREAFYTMIPLYCTFNGHSLETGDKEDIKTLCHVIVVDFDFDHLKPSRETHQRYKKLFH